MQILGVLSLLLVAMPPVPVLTRYVTDQANVMRTDDVRSLTDILSAHERSTTDQVIVLTVPALPPNTSLETFATATFNANNIGTKQANNGVLILLVLAERRIRIEVGLGLNKQRLIDADCQRIIADAVPLLKQSMSAGIVALGSKVTQHLATRR